MMSFLDLESSAGDLLCSEFPLLKFTPEILCELCASFIKEIKQWTPRKDAYNWLKKLATKNFAHPIKQWTPRKDAYYWLKKLARRS